MFRFFIQTLIIAGVCIAGFMTNAYAAKKEDPLRPPEYRLENAGTGGSIKTEPKWHVNEILFSGERRVALINDATVSKGDYIGGARVVDIKPAYVVLEYKNKLITARLKVLSVKNKVRKK